jgi:hypothetical protein
LFLWAIKRDGEYGTVSCGEHLGHLRILSGY